MPMRLLALVAGLIYPLAFAPWQFWPLVLLSIALAWRTLADASDWREALLRGWLYGFGAFIFGVFWVHVSMHQYGGTPLWLAIPMTALFAATLALFTALGFALTRAFARPTAMATAFAGFWLLTDLLRGSFLTGFPWLYAGYAMSDTWLAGLAPLGGVWLLTLVVVLTGIALGQLGKPLREHWRQALPCALLALVGWGLSSGERFYLDTRATGEPVPVALVQGNIPQDIRWQLTQRAATREIYSSLSATIPEDHLVIWPEAAITEFYQDAEKFLGHEGGALASRGGALITGIPWRERDNNDYLFFNSVTVVAGGEGTYFKQKLVPFGEFVPLQSLIRGLIPFFDLPMSSFTPGSRNQPGLEALGHTLYPFICYEIVYPEFVRRHAGQSDVLLTISNDAWFGTSAGPHQHFQMARLRARETGRWLLRGTNNGITAVINPRGQAVDRLPQFERDVLFSSFVPMQGSTLYMRSGGWPVWLFAALLVAVGLRRRTSSSV